MTHSIENADYFVASEYVVPSDPVTELCVAAYYGDAARLQALLADPNYKAKINHVISAETGHSALFFACYGESSATAVRMLLAAGADPLQRDAVGRMPLHVAAHAADPEVVAALFEAPSVYAHKLAAATETGQTPLHTLFMPGSGLGPSVKSKNADISKCIPYLLKRDENPLGTLHAQDKNRLSTLMLVKHRGLKAEFHPHVAPKTFDILLKSVVVPGNMGDLLAGYNASYVSVASLEVAAARPKLR